MFSLRDAAPHRAWLPAHLAAAAEERHTADMALDAERRNTAEIVDRLHRRFPSVPQQRIKRDVATITSSFRDAPIRDYIPILVEREAHKRLASMPADQKQAPPSRRTWLADAKERCRAALAR